MEVKKQWVNVAKTVYDSQVKAVCDGSIIVPDVKPDIMKVLQVDANTYLCDKSVEDGKITLSGKVSVTVLYTPEEDGNSICSIRSQFDFCEVIKNSEFEAGMQVITACDGERVTYKLINSRKIGIEAQIAIDIQAVKEVEKECICEIDGTEAQCRYQDISVESAGLYKEYTFGIEEDFTLQNVDIEEILKENIQIRDKEYKALTDKVVVKGKAILEALYLDKKGGIGHFAKELPFTEVIEMAGVGEENECDLTFEVKAVEISASGDGVRTVFDVSCGVRAESQKSVTALTGCYFTDSVEVLEFSQLCSAEIVARPKYRTVVKEMLTKKESMPDISGVYSAVAKPCVESVTVQKGRILVNGNLVVYVLYTADAHSMPVCSISQTVPFACTIDADGADEDCEVLLKGECEHLSTVICSADSVEVRCGIFLCGRVVKKSCVNLVTDAKKGEAEKKNKGILVYFVKKGDTCWDVAKRYRISERCVREAMGEDDELKEGRKLIIPIS